MKLLMLLCLMCSNFTLASIFPPNDLSIPIDAKDSKITEEQFNKAIDEIVSIYQPIIKKKI
jgi:hypothetical protein